MINSKRNLVFLLSSILLITIAAITLEYFINNKAGYATLNYTQDMLDYVALNDGIEVFVPSLENRALKEDVYGVAIPAEKRIYLALPQNIDEQNIVFYYLDTNGNYLAKMVQDFSFGNVRVGDTEIVLLKSSLPQLYLTINNQYTSFEELNAGEPKELTCYGDMHLVSPAKPGEPDIWTEEVISTENNLSIPNTISLIGRGHDSWSFRLKKPYTLVLEKAKDLLNMGKNARWNLLADSQDQSLLKNKMFLQLSKNIGLSFTPNAESVVLYVNHRYQGVYLLTTKVSVGKNRVNLNKNDFFFNWGAIEPEQPMYVISSSWFIDGDIEQPYADLLYPENDPDIESKRQILQQFISAIEGTSDENLTDIVDLNSMARYYWIQEVSMNFDAWSRSVYGYYRANTGKIYMGPIWDMDMTLGRNPVEKEGVSFMDPEGWKARTAGWYVPLFKHPKFQKEVVEVYYQGGVREALFNLIEEFETEKYQLANDGQLNFACWSDENISIVLRESGLYEQHTDNVISFYQKRIEWIDNQMQQELANTEGDLCSSEKN